MPEQKDYYNIPENFRIQRVNLRERPGQALRIEQPSGQLTITFFGKDRKFPHPVTSLPNEKTLVLIAQGEGEITRDGQKFELSGKPAVFIVDSQHPIQAEGDFLGWIVRLKESEHTQGLPTSQTNIDYWLPTESDLVKTIENDQFPNANGRIVRWCMGQWNSTSPINVAYEGGGLASIGDARFDLEDQISEIHLALQGRIVFKTADKPDLSAEFFDFPIRSGDVIIAKPGSVMRMGRYSGDYKGFCLKWSALPAGIIDPKRKIEI